MLPGIKRFTANGKAGPVVAPVSNQTRTDNDTGSATFSSMDFGTATTDRIIIAAIGYRRNNAHAAEITSVTIGGTAATMLYSYHPNDFTAVCFAARLVTSGPSGDVVANWTTGSDTSASSACALFTCTGTSKTGATLTVGTSGTATGNPRSITPSFLPRSAVIAQVQETGTANTSCTWSSNVTEYTDSDIDTFLWSTAYGTNLNGSQAITTTANSSWGSSDIMALITIAPQ